MRGRLRRACATRNRSAAVRRLIPARQDNQCAHERIPSPAQPPRSSNSPNNWRNRASAAAMCPAKPSNSDSSSGMVMACNGVGNGMTDTETSRDSAGVRGSGWHPGLTIPGPRVGRVPRNAGKGEAATAAAGRVGCAATVSRPPSRGLDTGLAALLDHRGGAVALAGSADPWVRSAERGNGRNCLMLARERIRSGTTGQWRRRPAETVSSRTGVPRSRGRPPE
jgi:hypothetical protein